MMRGDQPQTPKTKTSIMTQTAMTTCVQSQCTKRMEHGDIKKHCANVKKIVCIVAISTVWASKGEEGERGRKK